MTPTAAITKKAIALATQIGFDYNELPVPAQNGLINSALISQLGFDMTNQDIERNVSQSLDSYIRRNDVDAFLAVMNTLVKNTTPRYDADWEQHCNETLSTRDSDYPR